tara:strand:+ start:68 stop:403 length:336 start_codon:yes stop_codon:yes gene_type:complete
MKNILSVTKRASEQLKIIIKNSPNQIDGVLVSLDQSGCSGYSYKMDFVNKSEVKSYDLIKVKGVNLFIDPKATMFLIGSEMDYMIDKLSSRFVFNNPNQKNTCGCGESFNF